LNLKMIISKKIKVLLREFTPKNHWCVSQTNAYNTFFVLKEHFKTTPNLFLKSLQPVVKSSNYQQKWLEIRNKKQQHHKYYISQAPYSDLTVFSRIVAHLPQELQLQVSNSSAIRYLQLFQLTKGIEVFCNRGTSGIDGSSSTAIGAALIHDKPTLLITGDLSFLYDSNALWNKYIPSNFKIIVINNNGGGIFRILPGDKDAVYYSEFLETNHEYTAEHLAKMYHFCYSSVTQQKNLDIALKAFFTSSQKSILEIFTPPKVNDKVLFEYFI